MESDITFEAIAVGYVLPEEFVASRLVGSVRLLREDRRLDEDLEGRTRRGCVCMASLSPQPVR